MASIKLTSYKLYILLNGGIIKIERYFNISYWIQQSPTPIRLSISTLTSPRLDPGIIKYIRRFEQRLPLYFS